MGTTTTLSGMGRMQVTGIDYDPTTGYMKIYYRGINYSIEAQPYIYKAAIRNSFDGSFSVSTLSEMDCNSLHTSNGYFVDTYREKSGAEVTGRKINIKNLSTGDEFTVDESDLDITDVVPVNDVNTERWKLLAGIGIYKTVQ